MLFRSLLRCRFLGGALALGLLAAPARGQLFVENPDAGATLSAASNTGASTGAPLSAVAGTLSTVGDADLFLVRIFDPAAFSVSTVNVFTFVDTQLFVLTLAGEPVVLNDDAAGGLTLQSTIPAGSLSGLSAGLYYVGVSLSGNDPVSGAGQTLFADGLSTGLRGPNPSLAGSFGGFLDSGLGGNAGTYLFTLTGAQTGFLPPIPEPSVLALGAGGLLALLARRVRR
ncbi:MAG: hypothetical protein JSR82_07335 [Verrucomicrobia bacterium]|nr:hypothetical protein [Verrucomicrobiota bacterium]